MLKQDVFIVGAARTAVGSFLGMYVSTPAVQLGATAIKAAMERASIKPADVGEVFMGNVLTGGEGQAPARQACIFSGIPHSAPCTTVGKVCGSGAQAIILGARTIALGENDLVVAGGMENMSMAPYALPQGRSGYRMGQGVVTDLMVHDGLWDPYGNQHMGMFAELCAEKYGFTRALQDEFAIESYKRALAAIDGGRFTAEIVPVILKDKKKGDTELKIDEEPRKFNEAKMRELKAAEIGTAARSRRLVTAACFVVRSCRRSNMPRRHGRLASAGQGHRCEPTGARHDRQSCAAGGAEGRQAG